MHQGFGQANFGFGGLVLGSSKFQKMSKIPQKLLLLLKVVESDPKNNHIASLNKFKSKSPIHPVVAMKKTLDKKNT